MRDKLVLRLMSGCAHHLDLIDVIGQAKVRSTTQRRDKTWNPLIPFFLFNDF